ncbi:gluconate 2-dehydrogenase subunit 3 family protein [Natronomonas sp. EA1]|uniref:gluconate 2-dehydrogenase subunit 3 family protein n=1 Tax=Natronomonas sp. EA1 TaxID=3421655 RepID=UPI003EBFDD5A
MQLTRRDALAALAGAGIVGASGTAAVVRNASEEADIEEAPSEAIAPSRTHLVETFVAVAEVVYPSPVEGIPAFVETYVTGQLDSETLFADEVFDVVAVLDDHATAWYGGAFKTLDGETRDRLLREMDVNEADEDPDGTAAGRVRYFVVNELLYALYASPTGGKLVGIENPQGYPGGTQSYREGPDDEEQAGAEGER